MVFNKHVPAAVYTFNREIKPTKCLLKSIEIISHQVQDAQEGGGTPPTDQALEERPLQSSVPRWKMLLPSLLWSSLSPDSSWHEAEKLPVATGCENTRIWGKQIQHSFFYSFSPSHSRGPILGKMQGGLAAAERTLGMKSARITHFSLSSSSLTLQILLVSLWSVGIIWLQSLTFPAKMFKWISLLSYHFPNSSHTQNLPRARNRGKKDWAEMLLL